MDCPCCARRIEAAQVKERHARGLAMRLRCPHCAVWLGVDGRATLAKLAGVLMALAGGGVTLWGAAVLWPYAAGTGVAGMLLALAARRRELSLQPIGQAEQ